MIEPQYPTLRQVDKNEWVLTHQVIAKLNGYPTIKVPHGFHTDGASVPRIFWNICPPMSNYTNAAVVHDFLYVRRGDLETKKFTREEADEIFLLAMIELGVAKWRRGVMYKAVRWFGPRW